MNRKLSAVIFAAYVWFSALCPSFSQDSLDYHEVAKQLRDAGVAFHDQQRYQKAITAYSESLELFQHASVYVERSWSWLDLGENEKAIADCNRAIELDSKFLWAYTWRAKCYTEMKDYNHALSDFSTAIRLNPKEAIHYVSRAKLRVKLEQYDFAIEDMNEAVKIDSDNPFLYLCRASCYAAKKYWPQMLADADKMITLDPKSSDAYAIRGEANLALHHVDKAYIDFSKASDLDNLSPFAKSQLANFLVNYPVKEFLDHERAILLVTTLLQLQGSLDYEYVADLANILAEAGDIEDAIRLQHKAIKLAPESSRILARKKLEKYQLHLITPEQEHATDRELAR